MRQRFTLLLPVLLLAAACWAYAPGLSGGFLFDDFNNLDQLGAYGHVDNTRSLLLYLTSGSADPVGRPLSMLSFLLDARDWPADPLPFKRSNILLHLVNGLLLGLLLRRLGGRLKLQAVQASRAAWLGAGLWLLHPLLVSTTLYIVQREAMLPATFTLLGMLAWLHGSERLATAPWRGGLYLLAGAWGCTFLAMLCKANGVLLPLLLLVMEWTLPAAQQQPAVLGRSRLVLLGLPSLLLGAWLLSKLPGVFAGETDGRPWTLGQRLLTEPRVLCDYLRLLWLPQASGASVFNDAFRASGGWLRPWSTLPAALAVLGLLACGLALRRRHPALAFAILFYLAGQLLESTLIPLELYFEHRNYLPAMPLFWPLALWLTGAGPLRALRLALAVGLPLLLAVLCHARAAVWGRPLEQALLLAQVDPDSPRAQANAANYEMAHGRPDLAAQRMRQAQQRMPGQVQITLNWLAADCDSGGASAPALAAARDALAHDRQGSVMLRNWLAKAIDSAAQNRCPGMDLDTVQDLLHAARSNPAFRDGRAGDAEFERLEGELALARKDGNAALQAFNRALALFTTADSALVQAAMLGSAGYPGLGLEHLRYFHTLPRARRDIGLGMPALHSWLLERSGYWSSELAHMEQQLAEDAAARGGAAP